MGVILVISLREKSVVWHVSVWMGWNACLSRSMRETWEPCDTSRKSSTNWSLANTSGCVNRYGKARWMPSINAHNKWEDYLKDCSSFCFLSKNCLCRLTKEEEEPYSSFKMVKIVSGFTRSANKRNLIPTFASPSKWTGHTERGPFRCQSYADLSGRALHFLPNHKSTRRASPA